MFVQCDCGRRGCRFRQTFSSLGARAFLQHGVLADGAPRHGQSSGDLTPGHTPRVENPDTLLDNVLSKVSHRHVKWASDAPEAVFAMESMYFDAPIHCQGFRCVGLVGSGW